MQNSYKTSNAVRFVSNSVVERRVWSLLWQTKLHERYKLLLWKLLVDIIPTKDRIKQLIPLTDLNCYLCGQGPDNIHHLLLNCPIVILCWWNLNWVIKF